LPGTCGRCCCLDRGRRCPHAAHGERAHGHPQSPPSLSYRQHRDTSQKLLGKSTQGCRVSSGVLKGTPHGVHGVRPVNVITLLLLDVQCFPEHNAHRNRRTSERSHLQEYGVTKRKVRIGRVFRGKITMPRDQREPPSRPWDSVKTRRHLCAHRSNSARATLPAPRLYSMHPQQCANMRRPSHCSSTSYAGYRRPPN